VTVGPTEAGTASDLNPHPAPRPSQNARQLWLEVPDLLVAVIPLALTVLLLISGFTPILNTLSDPNTSWTGFPYQALVNRLSSYALAVQTPGTPPATLVRLREEALSSLRNRGEYVDLNAVEAIGTARLSRVEALFTAQLPGQNPAPGQNQTPGQRLSAIQEAARLNGQAHERVHQVQRRHASQLERLQLVLLLAAALSGLLSAALILRSLKLWRNERRALDNQRELLSLASHELRRPLQALLLATDLLRTAGSPEDRLLYLGVVENSAAQLASRADLGQLEALYGPVSPTSEVAQSEGASSRPSGSGPAPSGPMLDWQRVELAALLNSFEGPRTQVQVPTPPVWVRADPARLRQIVENLHENALRYSAGPVLLRLDVSAQRPELRVQDSGPGIDPADVERLFLPRERGPQAHQVPGSGLGLTVARRLAQAHGADLTLEAASGGGTIAVLRLAPQPAGEAGQSGDQG
jgi:signal transduction histidine kinase